MIKTIVFDIGNVIWDYRPFFDGYFDRWGRMIGRDGPYIRAEFEKVYTRFETNELDLRDWLYSLSPELDYYRCLSELQSYYRDHFDRYLNRSTLNIVKKLKKSGFELGCLTNTENFMYPYFRQSGLYNYFDFSILSWKVGSRKPHPLIFWEIFKHTVSRPDEILFIDDVPANLKGAQKLQLRTLQFVTSRQLSSDLKEIISSGQPVGTR